MSVQLIGILCLIGVVLAIVIGNVKKINIGIIALIFAYIIGSVLQGQFASSVTTLFPIKIMMYLVTVCYFYGFAILNGTMQALGDRIVYAFRNKPAALPFAIFIGAFIVAAAGGGGLMGVIVMAPIAFQLAKKANFSPLLAYMAVAMGSPLGGTTFWSVGGVTTRSIAESSGIEGALALVQKQSLALAIASISFFLILYFVTKGYKTQKVEVAKPEPMTKGQKTTLTMIAITIVLVVVPSLINIIAPNPVCKYLANYVCEIQLLSLIMGVLCTILKLGDEKQVLKTQIPWNMILTICGVGTLIAVASKFGVIKLVSEWIGTNLGGGAATIAMTAVGAGLSFVSDGMGVCMPTFYPMMTGIATAAGVSIAPMFLGFTVGIWGTAASPLSSAGGLGMSMCDEESRGKLFTTSLITTILYGVWIILLALVGVFNIFA